MPHPKLLLEEPDLGALTGPVYAFENDKQRVALLPISEFQISKPRFFTP
jgi:hypothetical protein